MSAPSVSIIIVITITNPARDLETQGRREGRLGESSSSEDELNFKKLKGPEFPGTGMFDSASLDQRNKGPVVLVCVMYSKTEAEFEIWMWWVIVRTKYRIFGGFLTFIFLLCHDFVMHDVPVKLPTVC